MLRADPMEHHPPSIEKEIREDSVGLGFGKRVTSSFSAALQAVKLWAGYSISLLLSFLLAGRGGYHTSVSGYFWGFSKQAFGKH